MKRKERHLIYEFVGLGLAGFGLAFSIPALVSAHDTVALLAALLLLLAWGGWGSFFFYRASQQG